MTKLSWTGFSKKTPQERKEHLKKNALLSQENQDLLDKDQQLTLETANQMAENVIGRFTLDRKSTRLNSSHIQKSRMPSSA